MNLRFLSSFQWRIFLLLLITSSALLLVIAWFLAGLQESRLYEQTGIRALVQAKQIAAIPDIIRATEQNDLQALMKLVNKMRQLSDATYITVGDRNGLRLYHIEAQKVGFPMEGDDNAGALTKAESYVSVSKGSLGTSLRGKAPIRTQEGQVIGVVSVGYTLQQLQDWHLSQLKLLFLPASILLLVLFICARIFSLHVKKQMFGLEPRELSHRLLQQRVVFDSVFEGLIAVDQNYRISAINLAARQMLKLQEPETQLKGYHAEDVIRSAGFFCTRPNENIKDDIALFNDIKVIASRMGVYLNNEHLGWVISFRKKDDISTLSLQLSQVQQYADNLRVIQHEHRNRIATLAGLLYLRRYEQAMALIQTQSEHHYQLLSFISDHFRNNHIAGLLAGKYYRAKELGIELVFSQGCRIDVLPDSLTSDEWVTIVGNLIDNACNASLRNQTGDRRIECLLNSEGTDVVIEVADQGCGIDKSIRDRIFERGVTTGIKQENGTGLWLVKNFVLQAGGEIFIEDNIPRGVIFSVYIPFTRKQSHG